MGAKVEVAMMLCGRVGLVSGWVGFLGMIGGWKSFFGAGWVGGEVFLWMGGYLMVFLGGWVDSDIVCNVIWWTV